MGRVTRFIAHELRRALPPTAFFFVLFHLVALTKAVVIEDYTVTALRSLGATVGALVIAKAILVIDALPIVRLRTERRIVHVLWRTVLYGCVVLLFEVVEELIHGIREHEGAGAAVRGVFEGIQWPVLAVIALWVAVGLLLYTLSAEIIRAVGKDRVREILFARGGGSAPARGE